MTGLLLQRPAAKLAKGSYFHGSFLLVAISNAVAPLFGLPFISGSLPHSPQFARSLSRLDGEQVVEVVENRLAPMLLYAGVGATLLVPELLEQIPDGASHVSRHDIAAVWVAFFSRWQRYRLPTG